MTHRYEELLPAEMEAIVADTPLAYVPSGTLEWHSYHLPLGLDGLKAQALCDLAAERSGGVVVPPTYWAINGMPHPWTMRFPPALIEALFAAVCQQLGHVGFRVAAIVAGHYSLEHYLALKRAALATMRTSGLTVLALADFELAVDDGYRGDHAAQWETSLLWSIRPDLVAMDRLPAEGPLEGVLGNDPRTHAGEAAGARMRDLIAERLGTGALRLLRDTSPLQRSAYIEALAAQVRVMEAIACQRETRPKSRVAPLLTGEYAAMLGALRDGEYREATALAEAALAAILDR